MDALRQSHSPPYQTGRNHIEVILVTLPAIGTKLQARTPIVSFAVGKADDDPLYARLRSRTAFLWVPASDRFGRKPIVLFASVLFIIASIGCASARSLPTLLTWRIVQGAGAGASMTIALAIIRDPPRASSPAPALGAILIAPNAMQGAMQPLPQIAGAAGAATGSIQMMTGAVVSGLVGTLYDEKSAVSMTALMAACSLVALVSYLLLARRAERVVVPS